MDPNEGSPFCLEQNGGARVAGGPKGRAQGCASQILPPLPIPKIHFLTVHKAARLKSVF